MALRLTLESLPIDVLLDIVAAGLSAADVLALKQTSQFLRNFASSRSLWFLVADILGRERSLSVPPFRTHRSLSTQELQDICLHSTRLRANWASKTPKLKGYRILELPHRTVDVQSMMFFRGGRHLLVALRKGIVLCMELETGKTLGRWDAGKEFGLYKWRILEGGRSAILIMYHDFDNSEGIKVGHLELTPNGDNSPTARFSELFNTLLPFSTLYAITGENIIGFLAFDLLNVESPLFLFVMNWRTQHRTIVHTAIPYNSAAQICAFSQNDTISILVELESGLANLHLYFIPELLKQPYWNGSLAPPVGALLRPDRTYRVPFSDNIPRLAPDWQGWYPMARTYQGFDTHEGCHPLSFLAVSSDTVAEAERREYKATFSQFFLPNPYHPEDDSPSSPFIIPRTFYDPVDLGPRTDHRHGPGGWDRWWPILATEAEHAVWVQRYQRDAKPAESSGSEDVGEMDTGEDGDDDDDTGGGGMDNDAEEANTPVEEPDNNRYELKLARFPRKDDLDQRRKSPEEITRDWVSTLEVPAELDVSRVKYLELDDARGTVLVATIKPTGAELFALMYA